MPTRKLLGAVVAAALFLPSSGFTLGLGEIEVNSALNQKLNADIELLSAAPEDTETIIVKLASRKEFTRAGLDRPYALNDLRFKAEIINDVPHIKVSSGGPIREPFLNFLVEIDWPNGHLIREYTVLLDPPVFMTQHASGATNQSGVASADAGFRPGSGGSTNVVPVAAPVTTSAARPGMSASTAQVPAGTVTQVPSTSQTSWIPAPFIQQQRFINQPAGSYKIKKGDTTWSLADAMRPDQSITVPQMMIAMLRANPESFINENINGLKRGYILRVPDYEQIASVSQADALALVREQAALWRKYQQSQAGGQPVSALPADDMGAAEGLPGDSAASAEDDAYLEIVSAGSGSSTQSGKDPTEMAAHELRAELALARERVETELVEKEALQQRVDTLQQHVDKMKGMLAIEDAELAEVQSLGLTDEATPVETELTEETMADGSSMQETDVEAMDEDLADMSAEAVLDEADAADEAVVDEVTSDETIAEDAVFVDETAAEKAEQLTPEQVEPATDDFVAPQPQIPAPKPADPLTQLLNDPMLLAAAGGGLLLIVALIGLIIKRRKAATETVVPAMTSGFDDLESLADDIANEADEFGKVAEAKVEPLTAEEEVADDFDSTATTILDSTKDAVIPEADSAAAAEEGGSPDDVIAEADVYLAYGIYQQAEDLLKQAIASNPERDDYRVKLAETHFVSKNAEAFVEVASDIKQRIDNEDSADWKKVMTMGQELCADNPMFQGSVLADVDVDSLSPDAPEMDFDLGSNETEDETPDLDLSLDEEPLESPEVMDDAEPANELEFDLSDADAVEESSDTKDELSLDIDASELDIDIKDEVDSSGAESIDLSDIDIGLNEVVDASSTDDTAEISDLDLDFGLDEAEPNVDIPDTEVSVADEDISIDLTKELESMGMGEDDASDADEITELAEVALDLSDISSDASDEEEAFDLSSLDDVDEISTKLDLARAYLDMGDHEGTRGILEEVLTDGDDEQKQEAGELMEKLG